MLADCEHYLLRTIAAVSISYNGSLLNKYEKALRTVRKRLQALRARRKESVLLAKVCELLESHEENQRFQWRCLTAQYLAEFASHVFYSSAVSTKLMEDDLITVNGTTTVYGLNALTFPGVRVVSPVALLLDRIRRCSTDTFCKEQTKVRSAWLLHALASAEVKP